MKVESRMNKRYGLLNRPRVTGEGYEASKMEESRAEMLRDAAFVVGPSGVTREINVLGMGLQASSFKSYRPRILTVTALHQIGPTARGKRCRNRCYVSIKVLILVHGLHAALFPRDHLEFRPWPPSPNDQRMALSPR